MRPELTFFVELEPGPLQALFDDHSCIDFLTRGGFGIAMAMLDSTDDRADVVRELEGHGVEVTAWLLVGSADGYFFNADNDAQGHRRYLDLREWAGAQGLVLPWVGLDIEPPRSDVELLTRSPVGGFRELLLRRRSPETIASAEASYARLVDSIHADGRLVEAYHLPQLLDERVARTTLLRRTFGIVDVAVDREVFMLYSTYFGEASVRGYMGEAQAIAVGCTGGGIDAGDPVVEEKFLDWPAIERDLLAAAVRRCPLYLFSLEGCVQRGMLEEILGLDWDRPAPALPSSSTAGARVARRGFQQLLRAEPFFDLIHRLRRAT